MPCEAPSGTSKQLAYAAWGSSNYQMSAQASRKSVALDATGGFVPHNWVPGCKKLVLHTNLRGTK